MVEFDNDGKVILETINQKVKHDDLNVPSINKCIYILIKDDLIKFVYEYLKHHKYCSKKFLAGILYREISSSQPTQSKKSPTKFQKENFAIFFSFEETGISKPI